MKQILVLFGGCSPEYSVSLASAYGVLTHMDRSLYQPIPVGITREGAWYWYPGPLEAIPQDRWRESPDCVPCTLRLDRGNCALLLLDGSGREIPFTAVFPVLHGKNGEDGTVQGLFELAGVPVIGCGALSSALCMDKVRSHQLAALAGVNRKDLAPLSPVAVLQRIGVAPGGVSPLHNRGHGLVNGEVLLFVDKDVLDIAPTAYCGAGRLDRTLELAPADLLTLCGGRPGAFSR